MRLLLVHQNFPGQFGGLAKAAARRGDQVVALHYRKELVFQEIETVRCDPPQAGPPGIHPWLREFDGQVRAGQATALRASQLRRDGFVPDVIVGHPGWGEMLFLRDVWPDCPLILYPEFCYRPGSAEARFDPEFNPTSEETMQRLRLKNSVNLHAFAAASRLWCPTEWQRSTLPPEQWSRTTVIHDGIDTDVAHPRSDVQVTLAREGRSYSFRPGDEVITFVNRDHEPARGFPTFMRALPAILKQRPDAHVIILGGDEIRYGAGPSGGGTWRERMMREVGAQLDTARVHFAGRVPKEVFFSVLQVSALHVYLTYPFVLSWSFLEAMSCGCCILASRTEPVTEFVTEGENGVLFDFFRPEELAEKAVEILGDRRSFEAMRWAARQTAISRCDFRSVCLPAQLRLIDEVAAGRPAG